MCPSLWGALLELYEHYNRCFQLKVRGINFQTFLFNMSLNLDRQPPTVTNSQTASLALQTHYLVHWMICVGRTQSPLPSPWSHFPKYWKIQQIYKDRKTCNIANLFLSRIIFADFSHLFNIKFFLSRFISIPLNTDKSTKCQCCTLKFY